MHFNPDLKLILAIDPSNYGIGAALSNKLPDGIERPVGYLPRSLNPAERNYSNHRQESFGCYRGSKKIPSVSVR